MTTKKTFQNLSPSKQDRITLAAIEEFSEKGYAGASINALVDHLGIAKGSIFQYFGDKKGLFYFIFDTCTEMVKARLRIIRDQTRDDQLFSRLEKSLTAGVAFLSEHPRIYKLYLQVLFGSKIPFRDEILLSLRKYSHEYLHSLLESARDKGELRENLDMDKACFVIDAIMDRFLQAHMIRHLDAGVGLHQADDPLIQVWIAELMEIIRHGIGRS
ncbi:MAG: TetR/AcrR family transcriptional regulator [Thermodesulfobacteriota bacterium]